MIDHDNLEEFRDAQIYDLQDEGYEDDYALTDRLVSFDDLRVPEMYLVYFV